MKTWNTPEIKELNVNQTAGGGTRENTPDDIYISPEQAEIVGMPAGEYRGFSRYSGR